MAAPEAGRAAPFPRNLEDGYAPGVPVLRSAHRELRAFRDSGELLRSLEELKGAPLTAADFSPPFPDPSKEELLAFLSPCFVEQWTAGLGSLDTAWRRYQVRAASGKERSDEALRIPAKKKLVVGIQV